MPLAARYTPRIATIYRALTLFSHTHAPDEAGDRATAKLASKPVVIGDAVPVPAICPEPVEQLLQVRT